jgi:predicted nuclease of predicted toxin-antitoxin system
MGHDAIHLYEQKLHKLPDSEILHKAKAEHRILLTMDLDFARLVSKAGTGEMASVVIFRLSDHRPQNVQAKLEKIFPIIERCIKQGGAIFSVGDEKIRVRSLPLL